MIQLDDEWDAAPKYDRNMEIAVCVVSGLMMLVILVVCGSSCTKNQPERLERVHDTRSR